MIGNGSNFKPSESAFMINYRVADLRGLMKALREEGCEVLDKIDESELRIFGWVMDPEGNKVEPAEYGIELDAIDGARDVVTFEDLGNGQTKLTLIGNETMERAKSSGQVEGWYEILDKFAAVVAGLEQTK